MATLFSISWSGPTRHPATEVSQTSFCRQTSSIATNIMKNNLSDKHIEIVRNVTLYSGGALLIFAFIKLTLYIFNILIACQ